MASFLRGARQGFRQLYKVAGSRGISTTPSLGAAAGEAPKSSITPVLLAIAVGGAAGAYFAKENGYLDVYLKKEAGPKVPDYGAVRQSIASLLDAEGHDDGSYGPVLVRLAWHASGTYDKGNAVQCGRVILKHEDGRSNGATMRFAPESEHGANAGLKLARDVLEPVKKQHPWISYADLWTLAGAVAIEEMGGPEIPWRPGRSDLPSGESCPPDGRLPDADKGAPHIRAIFGRMGFNDQEMVALSGAHTLGRCHAENSGYVNPWTNAPTTFSNLYFTELVNNKWSKKKWKGPLQYEDPTKALMMLPTDMALLWDKQFKKHVVEYAKDQDKFFTDFAAAFSKLMELGVPFPEE